MEAALAAHAALLESLQSNAQGTRKCGCELIGTVWKEVGDLRPTLDISAADDNNIVRHYVSNAIKVLNREQPVAVAALIDALGDSSKCVRCAAANALRKVGAGARDALPALTKCLDDKECIVSYNAAVALVEIDPEAGQEARPLLESFLKEGKYDSARVEACLKTLREAQATAP
jgi:HEAT repeat protein